MGTIPDFDPSAYASKDPPQSDVAGLDLARLAALFEFVRTELHQVRADRKTLEDPREGDRALVRLKTLQSITRDIFAAKLKQACGNKGILFGSIVYRVQPDGRGFERTLLVNPPLPSDSPSPTP